MIDKKSMEKHEKPSQKNTPFLTYIWDWENFEGDFHPPKMTPGGHTNYEPLTLPDDSTEII